MKVDAGQSSVKYVKWCKENKERIPVIKDQMASSLQIEQKRPTP
jgi:hypothetical protein